MTFLALAAALSFYVADLSRSAPDMTALEDYRPALITTVAAEDGRLIAEYAREHRVFLPVEAVPEHVINAFLAAEDSNFYAHRGVDYRSVIRAIGQNVAALGTDQRVIGASTITQQVVKNVLVGSDRTVDRKVTEALFAWKLERSRSKDEILEIYLNEVYFGLGAYGITEASARYFSKNPASLTLAEAAYLAALPKAPNNYHPYRQPERALERRNWVLDRIEDLALATPEVLEQARAAPLGVTPAPSQVLESGHYAAEVRRQLDEMFGGDAVLTEGYHVRTSLDPELQAMAHKALLNGLVAYDVRRGWRGPAAHVDELGEDWVTPLAFSDAVRDVPGWRPAIVLVVEDDMAEIGLVADYGNLGKKPVGETGTIPLENLAWARAQTSGGVGPKVQAVGDVLAVGDIIYVQADVEAEGSYVLRQIPEVGGALVAMEPATGRIRALVGGPSFQSSPFNRATQALRQPGSSFKPVVYSAALELGYTPSSTVHDSPVTIYLPEGPWSPKNYTNDFRGPMTMRRALQLSRNVAAVRVAQEIGFSLVGDYAERFGLYDRPRKEPSLALGAGETTLERMVTAYATFANGGLKVTPSVIDTVTDRNGSLVFSRPAQPGARLISEATAYQMTSMLQGVVDAGTGTAARITGRPVGGKTGTTNDHRDAWFIGFTPDLAAGVYIGYDDPKPLGSRETGGRLAAPIFGEFMKAALDGTPVKDFVVPPDITFHTVDATSGLDVDGEGFREAFKLGERPPTFGPSLWGSPRVFGSNRMPERDLGPRVTKTSPNGGTYSYREGSNVGTYTINGRTFTYERD